MKYTHQEVRAKADSLFMAGADRTVVEMLWAFANFLHMSEVKPSAPEDWEDFLRLCAEFKDKEEVRSNDLSRIAKELLIRAGRNLRIRS